MKIYHLLVFEASRNCSNKAIVVTCIANVCLVLVHSGVGSSSDLEVL